MNQVIKSTGILRADHQKIFLEVAQDFCDYYKWLIDHELWVEVSKNKFAPHITLWREKFNGKLQNPEKLKGFLGREVKFEYSPWVYIGGSTKPYKNFYLKCESPDFQYLEKELGFKQNDTFLGYHVTVGQIGKGVQVKKYQPKMIEIRCK